MQRASLWDVVEFGWIVDCLGLLEVRALALAAKSHPVSPVPFSPTPMRLLVDGRFLFEEQRRSDEFVADHFEHEEEKAREAYEAYLAELQYR